ncbi:MAG: Formyltetrahydrofolate deformylase [Actinomycetota bacterium]
MQHILTLSCPDQPGIVASIAQGLYELGANIVDNAQFGDEPSGLFCMRTRFEVGRDATDVEAELRPRATALSAVMRVRRIDEHPRVLVMVSKHDHCLVDLLHRWSAGELPVDISLVVSNHPDLEPIVAAAGIDFEHVPVTPATKPDAEARLVQLVEERSIDLVVLARYMQVLSDDLCAGLSGRAINIHHSFLPGFKGARPYHQAWDRGVKLIGATAHFVTAELDEGPIIDQDVARVTHAVTADDMVVLGKDLERIVLSRAVKAWAEGRVFLAGKRTVVLP